MPEKQERDFTIEDRAHWKVFLDSNAGRRGLAYLQIDQRLKVTKNVATADALFSLGRIAAFDEVVELVKALGVVPEQPTVEQSPLIDNRSKRVGVD
jgi:hypothetical protein